MQRSRKSLLVKGGKKALRGPGAALARARASSGLPATPEALSLTETSRAGVRQLPRFAAAAAAPANDGDDKDRGGESQPLISPPGPVMVMTNVCDWAQAIQCTYLSLKPMPCQRDGCDALVYHLCQGAWERLKGYEDTVACLCCAHHPDYKYVGAPSKKVSVAVANAQNVMSKAKVVNVESQMTTDSNDFAKEDSEESSKADGSDDHSRNSPISGGGKGVGVDEDNVSLLLPPFEITDYTADTYDIHERTAHFMERRPITASNRIAVEAVYMVEALTIVKSMKTMRKAEIAQ